MPQDPLTDWISMTRAWGIEALSHTSSQTRRIERPPIDGVAVTIVRRGEAHLTSRARRLTIRQGEAVMLISGEAHTLELHPWKKGEEAELLTIAYEDSRCPVSSLWARRTSDVLHLESQTLAQVSGVETLTTLLIEELRHQAPATGGLLDALMVMLLRAAMRSSSAGVWLHGLEDAVIRDALRAIHADPAHTWTLEELARHVGVSRSSLASRFTRELGESAMSYVRRWRMSLAARQLLGGEATIEEISSMVGYESAHAFSRAFKSVFGQPPAHFRNAQPRTRREPHEFILSDASIHLSDHESSVADE